MNASRQTRRQATRDELIDLAISKAMFRDRAQFDQSNANIQAAALRVIERIARQMTFYVDEVKTARISKSKAEILASVMAGNLPPVPDFSAELHRRNRARLAALVAMAEAGDIAGLEAVVIIPNCTSPKAMLRYRDLAVQALRARASQQQRAA